MYSRCVASFESNCKGVGARLAPLQKGAPDAVTWSAGKLCNNWAMESWKHCWNSSLAQATQSWYDDGRWSTKFVLTRIAVSSFVFG